MLSNASPTTKDLRRVLGSLDDAKSENVLEEGQSMPPLESEGTPLKSKPEAQSSSSSIPLDSTSQSDPWPSWGANLAWASSESKPIDDGAAAWANLYSKSTNLANTGTEWKRAWLDGLEASRVLTMSIRDIEATLRYNIARFVLKSDQSTVSSPPASPFAAQVMPAANTHPGPLGGGNWSPQLRHPVEKDIIAVLGDRTTSSSSHTSDSGAAAPSAGDDLLKMPQELCPLKSARVSQAFNEDTDGVLDGSVVTEHALESAANPFDQWYKYDDTSVTPVTAEEAINSNFGSPLRTDGSWETFGQSAYMLVYVNEDAAENVCFPMAIPGEPNERIDSDREISSSELVPPLAASTASSSSSSSASNSKSHMEQPVDSIQPSDSSTCSEPIAETQCHALQKLAPIWAQRVISDDSMLLASAGVNALNDCKALVAACKTEGESKSNSHLSVEETSTKRPRVDTTASVRSKVMVDSKSDKSLPRTSLPEANKPAELLRKRMRGELEIGSAKAETSTAALALLP